MAVVVLQPHTPLPLVLFGYLGCVSSSPSPSPSPSVQRGTVQCICESVVNCYSANTQPPVRKHTSMKALRLFVPLIGCHRRVHRLSLFWVDPSSLVHWLKRVLVVVDIPRSPQHHHRITAAALELGPIVPQHTLVMTKWTTDTTEQSS